MVSTRRRSRKVQSSPASVRRSPRPSASQSSSRARRSLRAPLLSVPTPPLRTGLNSARSRLLMVWGLLMLSLGALGVNLFRLQVLQADVLQERAIDQQVIALSSFLPRRSILDRNGDVLAIDEPVYTLYAHPILFRSDSTAIGQQLAPILERPASELIQALNSGESGIRMVDDLPEDVARRIRLLRIDGLELVQTHQRLYPQRDLFGTILGYVDVDREGQAGLEVSQAELLERKLDQIELTRTGEGLILPTNLPEQAYIPDELQLQTTLDSDLQRVAYHAIQRQVAAFSAKRGAVLVMDAWDGSILAMASEPSYDPNRYYEADVEAFKNWVLSDVYEPGSTFKPINVAIALEEKAIQPGDYFDDPGHIQVGGWPIENYNYDYVGGRGSIDVTEILRSSSNVGMVRIMQQLSAGIYYEWLEKLGLGKITGIDLPFEGAGHLKDREQFVGASIEPATAAFGQGISLTPVQLLQLHATLANGGKLVVPHVVQGLVDPDGNLQWQPTRSQPQPIFSSQVARTVVEMMETVVTDGTGVTAQIPGYRIAGKTGTSQKAGEHGGYLEGVKITSFVATFPVNRPRYVVLVVVDEPVGQDALGSTVAAPVARTVIETLITLEKIPPSEMEEFVSEPRPPLPPSESTTETDGEEWKLEPEDNWPEGE
jgi:cell division protein FtsI (penicillin-binding protein 3)